MVEEALQDLSELWQPCPSNKFVVKNHSIVRVYSFFIQYYTAIRFALFSYLGKMKRNGCVDDDVDGDGGNDQ